MKYGSFEALRTGDKADMALPPQMEVPAQMSSESGDEILKARARAKPKMKTRLILINVMSIPPIPFSSTL